MVSWESHDLRSASREGLYWYIYTTYLVKILWFVGKIREASGRRVLVSGLRRRSDENPMKSFIRKVEKERRYRVEKELRHCQISMKRQILKVTDLYRSFILHVLYIKTCGTGYLVPVYILIRIYLVRKFSSQTPYGRIATVNE